MRGNQFGVSWFESLQGQTCKCSSESERGQNRDCYQSLEPVREAVTQWALGLPLLALFKSFCSVLTVTFPCMQTPAERWVNSTGFDQEMKCQRPCFLSYIRTSVFLFNLSKRTLKTHDGPTARNLPKIVCQPPLTVRTLTMFCTCKFFCVCSHILTSTLITAWLCFYACAVVLINKPPYCNPPSWIPGIWGATLGL